MRFKIHIVFVVLCIPVFLHSQQMPLVSLFEQNQTFYNPASIGNQEVLAANFFYRAHWTGFDGAPSTQVFCAHAPLRDPSVAMGVQVEHDAIGATNNTGIYIHYAYRLNLGTNRVSFGLKGGISSISTGRVTLEDDAPDPAFSEDNQTSFVPNFGVGMLFYGRQYWAGISVPRLFGFKNTESGDYKMYHDFANYEYLIIGGGRFQAGSKLSVDPSALLKFSNPIKSDKSDSTNRYNSSYSKCFALMGTAVYKKVYKAGIGFRLGWDKPISDEANSGKADFSKTIILAIGYQLNRQFSLAYSYDLNIDEISPYTSGSHEINIGYKFGYKVNASNPRDFTK